MPIANTDEAHEVGERLYDILAAPDDDNRANAMRLPFVEALDWDYADGLATLNAAGSEDLARDARILARKDGVIAAYITLNADRITSGAVNAAARSLSANLGDDLLVLLTNAACNQFHIILPDFTGNRPTLQRMVARRGEHHRTVVQGGAGYEAVLRRVQAGIQGGEKRHHGHIE